MDLPETKPAPAHKKSPGITPPPRLLLSPPVYVLALLFPCPILMPLSRNSKELLQSQGNYQPTSRTSPMNAPDLPLYQNGRAPARGQKRCPLLPASRDMTPLVSPRNAPLRKEGSSKLTPRAPLILLLPPTLAAPCLCRNRKAAEPSRRAVILPRRRCPQPSLSGMEGAREKAQ